MSNSGARTRCAELVEMGLVEDSGMRRVLPTNRKAIVWRIPENLMVDKEVRDE